MAFYLACGEVTQKCEVCKASRRGETPVKWHEAWGCDAPVPDDQPPALIIQCPICLGSGCEDNPQCKGGHLEIRRCPNVLVGEREARAMNAYIWYEKGFLPNAGGYMEHPATFVMAMNHLMRLKAKREREQAEKNDRKNRS